MQLLSLLFCSQQAKFFFQFFYSNIETIPSVKQNLQDLRCCDGDKVTFECKFDGNSSFDIRWEKDGKVSHNLITKKRCVLRFSIEYSWSGWEKILLLSLMEKLPSCRLVKFILKMRVNIHASLITSWEMFSHRLV